MEMIFFHNHTEYSLNDGAQSVKQFVARIEKICCEHGATKAIVMVTEHGHMMSLYELVAEAKKSSIEIQVIPAFEAYVATAMNNDADEEEDFETAHMVLAAKDNVGLHALYRATTAGFDNEVKGKPVITNDVLQALFGEGSEAHGHVIAFSACMQGVLCLPARANELTERKAEKCERKASKIDINMDEYYDAMVKLDEAEQELETLAEQRKNAYVLKGKKFTLQERALKKLPEGSDEYNKALAELNTLKEEALNAATSYPMLKEKESEMSKSTTTLRQGVKKMAIKAEKVQELLAEADDIREQLVDDGTIRSNVISAAKHYQEIFGAGNFFVELQYHGIPQEAQCFPLVASVAEELDIPVIATNDAHIATPTEDERFRRQTLRSLRWNKWQEENTGDDELYIKTPEQIGEALQKILPLYTVENAIANLEVVANMCDVTLSADEHYPKFISEDGRDALAVLKDLCNERYKEYRTTLPREQWNTYVSRIRYEVSVIDKLGVADYLLIVQDFLEYGRLLGKIDMNDPRFLADPFNIALLKELGKGNVGMSVGIGRGSAVGSLVCFLIGITGADPIKYNLLFERFLNTERVTMPKQYWAFNVNFIAQRCAA